MSFVHIFGIPKPARMGAQTIQTNAIMSWLRLPGVSVTLFGDAADRAMIEDWGGVQYGGELLCNAYGTPLVSAAFEQMQQRVPSATLCYVNCDVILTPGFVHAVSATVRALPRFLLVGRRTDIRIERLLDFATGDGDAVVEEEARLNGRLHPPYGIDYFVTPAACVGTLMPLAVGRGNWDNWFVAHYRKRGIPVVDGTADIEAFHQAHDYSHVAGGRHAITYGPEARTHVDQCAGDFLQMSILDATHVLRKGVVRQDFSEDRLLRRASMGARLLPVVGAFIRRLKPYRLPEGPR
jgi:hypothetical protein